MHALLFYFQIVMLPPWWSSIKKVRHVQLITNYENKKLIFSLISHGYLFK